MKKQRYYAIIKRMRVIQPPHHRVKTKKRRGKKLKSGLLSVFIVALMAVGVWFGMNVRESTSSNDDSGVNQAVLAQQQKQKDAENAQPEDYKYFSADEFKQLYDNIVYPNTQPLRQPPEITGNAAADSRIREIATSRGYTLRSVPVAPIEKTDNPGLIGDDLIQQKAFVDLNKLLEAANAANIPLRLNSGYRSVEMQRELFLGRLYASGVSVAQIAGGHADNAVVAVLSQAAIPGYSRHHTGYTVDFVCGNAVQKFETTTCFKWLEQNNYLNAKMHGWIPSYPEGASQQGPEPESWEFVWVSKQALLK